LKWLPSLTPEDESINAAELLSQTNGSFEMATLALISDFCTDEERTAVIDRYLEMFDAALSANNTAELGSLFALVAYWNNTPSIRSRLTEIDNKVALIEVLSLPEKRVNNIVAEIYVQIDTLTGNTVSTFPCRFYSTSMANSHVIFLYNQKKLSYFDSYSLLRVNFGADFDSFWVKYNETIRKQKTLFGDCLEKGLEDYESMRFERMKGVWSDEPFF